jgi:hypothetical protein
MALCKLVYDHSRGASWVFYRSVFSKSPLCLIVLNVLAVVERGSYMLIYILENVMLSSVLAVLETQDGK